MKRIWFVGVAVVGFALGAQAAQAASRKIESTPNPSGATSSQLNGVSCSAASACTAVGNYTDSGGTVVTLAERYS